MACNVEKILNDIVSTLSNQVALADNIKEIYDISRGYINPLVADGVQEKDSYGNAKTDLAMADVANKFIGFGKPNTTTEKYSKAFGENSNTGTYNENDIVMVNGNIPTQDGSITIYDTVDMFKKNYIEELIKAFKSGATIIFSDNQGTDAHLLSFFGSTDPVFDKDKGYYTVKGMKPKQKEDSDKKQEQQEQQDEANDSYNDNEVELTTYEDFTIEVRIRQF